MYLIRLDDDLPPFRERFELEEVPDSPAAACGSVVGRSADGRRGMTRPRARSGPPVYDAPVALPETPLAADAPSRTTAPRALQLS